MIKLRLRRRDRYSLELKFIHRITPVDAVSSNTDTALTRKKHKTKVNVYFFLPKSFAIDMRTLDAESLFDDIKLYLRFDTPKRNFAESFGDNPRFSPIAAIEQAAKNGPPWDRTRIIYELKLLGAISKSHLRDALKALIRDNNISGKCMTQEVCGPFLKAIDTIVKAEHKVHTLRVYFQDDRILVEHIDLIEEHISLTLEHYVGECLWNTHLQVKDEVVPILENHITTQQKLRLQRGYPSVVEEGDGRKKCEEYVYRKKNLKRYVSSALFLQIRRKNESKRVEHLTYAFAAGLAMAVATAVSFISQIRFTSLEGTLFLILVATYMVKDRIKDLFRGVFNRSLGRLFYDRRTTFRDSHHNRKLGLVKERIRFVKPNRVAKPILQVRGQGGFKRVVLSASPENVLEYEKEFILEKTTLSRIDSRIDGVADISIIDVKKLLRFLARKTHTIPVLGDTTVLAKRVRRIYHLNMIIECRTGKRVYRRKIRLVTDSGGIRRVEHPSE